ncbi:hypothetical protein BH24ACT3_BH24ACT3_09380 [soil metagenome]
MVPLRCIVDLAALAAPIALVADPQAAHVGFAILTLATLAASGAYARKIKLSLLDDVPHLVVPVAVSLLVVAATSIVVDVPGSLYSQGAMAAGTVVAARALSYAGIRFARLRGKSSERALIVGAGAIGLELHRLLTERLEYGLSSVGVIDDVPADPAIPLLGSIVELPEVVRRHDVQRIIVAFGPTGEQEMVATLRAAVQLDVQIHVVPRFFEVGLAPTGAGIEQIWGIPVYRLRRAALTESFWKFKRLTDIVVSAALLVATSWLLAILALAVRLSSSGPVLFRQVRIGQDRREIEVLKFRTLLVNDDEATTWSVVDDPRLTSVGRWLRRFSLDELPQLWNVLRGDMSLIGPRPERPHFVHQYSSRFLGYGARHRLPVGLTGLAQVHGLRGDTSIEERVRFDNFCIEHWSPWLDVKILVRTLTAVVRDALGCPSARDGADSNWDEQDSSPTR